MISCSVGVSLGQFVLFFPNQSAASPSICAAVVSLFTVDTLAAFMLVVVVVVMSV